MSATAGVACSTSSAYSGTNATNPKYAIARTVTNAESFEKDTQSSVPCPVRDVACAGMNVRKRRSSTSTIVPRIQIGTSRPLPGTARTRWPGAAARK